MRFSIITSVYNEYEILRQLIESILQNVNKATYKDIIIFDDYSYNKKLREYLLYLDKTYDFIKIIIHDESRLNPYDFGNEEVRQKEGHLYSNLDKPSCGPVCSMRHASKLVNTDFYLAVDTDIIFRSHFGSLFNKMAKLFDDQPTVAMMGQCMGYKKDLHIHPDPAEWYLKDPIKYGAPSPMANAVRNSIFDDPHIVRYATSDDSTAFYGWNHTLVLRSLFYEDIWDGKIKRKKYYTMNFPLFTDGYLVHIGGGTVNFHRYKRRSRKFGFVLDGDPGYGGTKYNDDYSGKVKIKMSHNEYVSYLKKTYKKPFEQIQKIPETMFK